MGWMQVLSIIGANLAIFSILGGFLVYHANRMDIQLIATNQRMDQLYTMFIDLLKEGKNKC